MKIFEKILIVIILIVIIGMAKYFVINEEKKDKVEKARIASLEKTALKVDSLEKIIDIYNINDSCLDVEIDANCKEFTRYCENNFTTNSIKKVVIIATSLNEDSLRWHIKVKH